MKIDSWCCGRVVGKMEEENPGINFAYYSRLFLRELEPYSLSDEIRREALDVYRNIIKLKRKGQRRKHLQFFCLYTAYNQLKIPQDPLALAQLIKLDRSDITRALSIFSCVQTGYKAAPSMYKTPKDLLPVYTSKMQLSDELSADVLTFGNDILTKNPNLAERCPQKIAAAILQYYLGMQGYDIDKAEYAAMIGVSEGTLNNACKQVAKVHNR